MTTSSGPKQAPKMFLFGPQALAFDLPFFDQLRLHLRNNTRAQWALNTLLELPSVWESVRHHVTKFQHLDGNSVLHDLEQGLRTGSISPSLFPLPNILLSPLVVVAQLTQYTAFVTAAFPDLTDTDDFPASITENTETLGLCTGLLSAFAVSSSSNLGQLYANGAVAVKLALLVGALVDAEEVAPGSHGRARSVSVSWNSAESKNTLQGILTAHPEAYISVYVDEKRSTMTVSERKATDLVQKLKTAGFHVTEVALAGRFHYPGHTEDTEELMKLCSSRSDFQFLRPSGRILPNILATGNPLHETALREILLKPCEWLDTFTKAYSVHREVGEPAVICFGPERCIPPTMTRKLSTPPIQVSDIDLNDSSLPRQLIGSGPSLEDLPDDRVAVIGMACHVPGAQDLEGYWRILSSGQSQHKEVPGERFPMRTAFRELEPSRKWYGNFIDDHDAFDHKFFKKSPREMASADPQHRIIMQLAYQAVEQSGYFTAPLAEKNDHIGCYIGIGNVDYDRNIACYPGNAYSATGNLRSFVAGKVSHHFGWTGPSMTVDTACSSSGVAVHQACRAILHGECTSALAGGVNVLTNPDWFHNLAGASFLSPTGQCKPFDAKGDGYCRGEGAGVVFLKKLSTAIADGDQVLGVIASTRVYQNQNCTPITVPNTGSLSELFRDIVKHARLEPKSISVVEAHGTGTPVGDPAEYAAIRRTLGGSNRSDPLHLTSVKGLLGHTEFASGIVSLVKVLLMIHEARIPPQASFASPSPALQATRQDLIEIPTHSKEWDVNFRAALINNYGASGSNASIVVTQAPTLKDSRPNLASTNGVSFPFWFSGNDLQGIRTYLSEFRSFLQRHAGTAKDLSARNLSFQLARQSNRTLPKGFVVTASSSTDLQQKLLGFEQSHPADAEIQPPPARPVVLCFGGQISTFVGLSQELYDNITALRIHLDECNAICLSLGLGSIYPDIFQRSPIEDIVKLQTVLFATQYACAQVWRESGVHVSAVVGHSFGTLTALCVAGTCTLTDALRLISGRARLIQDGWGAEKGAMLAIEGDLADVHTLVAQSVEESNGASDVSIACYNGLRSFTLAGSAKAINFTEDLVRNNAAFAGLKMTKLNVTHAFHSSLVEPLMEDLTALGREIVFQEPVLRMELSTETKTIGKLGGDFIAQHLRNPVFFSHAVQRIAQDFPNAIWLEAGMNSTITAMASRALGDQTAGHHFQPVNLNAKSALQNLVDTTTKLWKAGLNVSFWGHHAKQVSDYTPVILPPYQFEKSRHWMELQEPPKSEAQVVTIVQQAEVPKGLTTFLGYEDQSKQSARFRVNTGFDHLQSLTAANLVANTAEVVPGILQLQIALDALAYLQPDFEGAKLQPEIRGVSYHNALVLDSSLDLSLTLSSGDANGLVWVWKLQASDSTVFTSGTVELRPVSDPQLQHEYEGLERLSGRRHCTRLLSDDSADEVLQGRNIYRAFEQVVKYGEPFRHVTKIAAKESESAGRVSKRYDGKAGIDPVLTECFCNVAAIFVNLMTDPLDLSERGIFVCDGLSRWIRNPNVDTTNSLSGDWEIYAVHHRESEARYVSDVFAFDPRDGSLFEAVLGISYQRVPMGSLQRVLSRKLQLGPGLSPNLTATSAPSTVVVTPSSTHPSESPSPVALANRLEKKTKVVKKAGPDITGKTREIVCNLSGLEPEEIQNDSDLIELGIDSLMAMELVREVEAAFKCTLKNEQLMELTDFHSLVQCIRSTLGLDEEEEDEVEEPTESAGDTAPKTNGINGANGVHGHHDANGLNGHASLHTSNSGVDVTSITSAIRDIFNEIKWTTDDAIVNGKLAGYYKEVMPRSTELCIVYIVNAFEHLGCPIRSAKPGERLQRIPYDPKHTRFVDLIYGLLETEARLIDINGSEITRTAVSPPTASADTLLAKLIQDEPIHAAEHRLTALVGERFSNLILGKEDGLQLIFGTPEAREIASDMYANSPINTAWISQLADFLQKLVGRLPRTGEPICILEIGAGTGGTTSKIVPLLAQLGVPVKYTMTDISGSLIAAARKRFKQYPFMEFKALNMETPPDAKFLHSQHIVLATNCIHATRNLSISLKNIHHILRPEGFLIMLEMTQQVPWVDFIFGFLEGWWLFEDGRDYVLQPTSYWQKVLQSVGYGHVDWTAGDLPEASIQRLIIAHASGPRYEPAPKPVLPATPDFALTDEPERRAMIQAYVAKYTQDFHPPSRSTAANTPLNTGRCVLVTGGTGSLGGHIVSDLAQRSDIETVICLNRLSTIEPNQRQRDSLQMRGIVLDAAIMKKLQVIESDTSKPNLGLSSEIYASLIHSVTHIVHSAWPMSLTRPIRTYESQFKTARNLINLAVDVAKHRPASFKVGFQFISSSAVIANYPAWTGNPLVPEAPGTIASLPRTGYAEAKLVVETMLAQTLHRHADSFHAMAVRVAQIAGSTSNGYWNPTEYMPFLIRSSQSLRLLPDLDGTLSWCPANHVAATLGELLLAETSIDMIYQIDNPSRQGWKEMIRTLARSLGIDEKGIVPYDTWVDRVRRFRASVHDNPALQLIEFFDHYFVPMSCGGLVLDTVKARSHSQTLAQRGPIDDALMMKYIARWKHSGFLSP